MVINASYTNIYASFLERQIICILQQGKKHVLCGENAIQNFPGQKLHCLIF